MSATNRPRLAIVASHPIQHFCPLYRGLAASGKLDLKVFFASDAGKRAYYDPAFGRDVDWGTDVTAGFDHEFLPGSSTYDLTAQPGNRALAARLAEFDPQVVQLYGYSSKLSRQALGWTVRTRRRSLMTGDSELLSPRGHAARLTKAVALPALFRLPTGFLTIGDENERYYRHYLVPEHRLWRSPIPIDSPQLDRLSVDRAQTRSAMRAEWKASDLDVVLLVVGKSIARKSHDHVLQAMARLSGSARARTIAVFAGGGPETDRLLQLTKDLEVRGILAGFLPIPELMRSYLSSDVLVHPSACDPHPLAIAEGIYAGLPVVLSDRVGSWGPTDDVRPGRNGLRYRYGDIDELTACIAALVNDPSRRQALGRHSTQIGAGRDLDAAVASYVDAVFKAVG